MLPPSIRRFVLVLGLFVPLASIESGCSTKQEEWIGRVAPEIDGPDMDGADFKLSEFRGKVVLLEFWGNWYSPCRELYPTDRALLERYSNEAFEIVGVNSDTQLDQLKQVMEKQKIGWRSFSNGPKGANGPISKAWGVSEWPTICLIDAKGVIRYRVTEVKIAEIEAALKKLLAESATAVSKAK